MLFNYIVSFYVGYCKIFVYFLNKFLFVYFFKRWTPVNGFSGKNLLPTDRKNWSDEIGEGYYPKESFQLPSQYWEWEGGWIVDENFRGHLTDRGVSIVV